MEDDPEAPSATPAAEAEAPPEIGNQGLKDAVARGTRLLPVRLSEATLAQKALELRDAWGELEEARKILKETTATLKDDVKEKEVAFEKIMDVVHDGTEDREVLVEDVFDWDTKTVVTHRLDLQADDPARIVERRSMTDKEMQFPLPFVKPTPPSMENIEALADPVPVAEMIQPEEKPADDEDLGPDCDHEQAFAELSKSGAGSAICSGCGGRVVVRAEPLPDPGAEGMRVAPERPVPATDDEGGTPGVAPITDLSQLKGAMEANEKSRAKKAQERPH